MYRGVNLGIRMIIVVKTHFKEKIIASALKEVTKKRYFGALFLLVSNN